MSSFHRLLVALGYAVLALTLAACGGSIRSVTDVDHAKNKALIGQREYVFDLIDALEYADDPALKLVIVNALDEIGDPAATTGLVKVMKDQEEDPTVRTAVPLVLARIGDRRALEPLSQILLDPDSNMRRSALRALQSLGEVPVEAYLAGLRSPDEQIQLESVRGIGALRDISAIPLLFDVFFDSVTGFVAREQIVSELGRLGDPGLDALYHILIQTSDETLQGTIVREMENSPSDKAERLLAEYSGGEGGFGWDLRWETPRGEKVVSGTVLEVNIVAEGNASLILLTERGRHVHCHFASHTNELLYLKSEFAPGTARVSVGGSSYILEELLHINAETIQIVP